MPQQYYGQNDRQNQGGQKPSIPWWLIVGCFMVGLAPLGLILLFIRLSQDNKMNGGRADRQFDQYGQQARRGAEEVRRAAQEAAQQAKDAAQRARAAGERARQQAGEQNWQRGDAQGQQNGAAGATKADFEAAYTYAKKRSDKVIHEAGEEERSEGSGVYRTADSAPNAKTEGYGTYKRADHAGGTKGEGYGAYKSVEIPGVGTVRKESAGESKDYRARLRKVKSGSFLSFVGAAMMILGGIATAGVLWQQLPYIMSEPLWFIQEAWLNMVTTGLGAGIFLVGHLRKGKSKRYRRYINLVGEQTQVPLSALASAFPAKHSAVVDTLQDMIDAGVFGDRAYLDFGRDMLILDGSGVRAEEPREASADGQDSENDLLREIRQVNDQIRHPEMSRKIDRVGEITESILEFQREHPERSTELHKFLDYYLPTTLKILRSYAELEKQGVGGDNIDTTKKRIENMMDMVVAGFERQLDKLFAGDMMDITADITVMERMMAGDGLFGNDAFRPKPEPSGDKGEQMGAH